MSLDKFDGLTEEECKEELRRIREERSQKSRGIRKAAKTRRIEGARKDKKRKANVQAVEEADWV